MLSWSIQQMRHLASQLNLKTLIEFLSFLGIKEWKACIAWNRIAHAVGRDHPWIKDHPGQSPEAAIGNWFHKAVQYRSKAGSPHGTHLRKRKHTQGSYLRQTAQTSPCFPQRCEIRRVPQANTFLVGSCCYLMASAHGTCPRLQPLLLPRIAALWPVTASLRMAFCCTTAVWKTGFLELACRKLFREWLRTQNKEGRMRLEDFTDPSTPQIQLISINSHRNTSCFEH